MNNTNNKYKKINLILKLFKINLIFNKNKWNKIKKK